MAALFFLCGLHHHHSATRYVRGEKSFFSARKLLEAIKAGKCQFHAIEIMACPDGKFSLNTLRCVGACGLAPVAMVGDKVYGRLTPADVKTIVDEYRAME